MKQIPLLYQTDMVQSLLRGWKTNTRRTKGLNKINKDPDAYKFLGLNIVSLSVKKPRALCAQFQDKNSFILNIECPYGNTGDVIWVRETFYEHGFAGNCLFKADGHTLATDQDKWKPSIFLKYEDARIFLKITNIKVERLRDISEADAIAEGIYRWKDADHYFDHLRTLPPDETRVLFAHELEIRESMKGYNLYKQYIHDFEVPHEIAVTGDAVESYIGLFLSINRQKELSLNHPVNNPWIWAITFEVLSTTGRPEDIPLLPEKYSTKRSKNIPV